MTSLDTGFAHAAAEDRRHRLMQTCRHPLRVVLGSTGHCKAHWKAGPRALDGMEEKLKSYMTPGLLGHLYGQQNAALGQMTQKGING